MQVSDKERQAQFDSTWKEIAAIVSQQCINPETRKPYPVTMIEKAMKDLHYSIKPKQNSKQQALEVIRQLKERIPIDRAQMRLGVTVPVQDSKRMRERLAPLLAKTERLEKGEHSQTIVS